MVSFWDTSAKVKLDSIKEVLNYNLLYRRSTSWQEEPLSFLMCPNCRSISEYDPEWYMCHSCDSREQPVFHHRIEYDTELVARHILTPRLYKRVNPRYMSFRKLQTRNLDKH
jgi:hypothetical protein